MNELKLTVAVGGGRDVAQPVVRPALGMEVGVFVSEAVTGRVIGARVGCMTFSTRLP